MDCVINLGSESLTVFLWNVGSREIITNSMQVRVQLLSRHDLRAGQGVFILVQFSLFQHFFDISGREPALFVRDLDLLLVVRAHVLSAHLEDSVGIDIEGDSDLRHSAQRPGETLQREGAQEVIVLHQSPLTLVHLDLHMLLVVLCGGKILTLVGWNGAVPFNELLHHAPRSLYAQRKWRDIQK
mmetsp:Transcript_34326/g.91771  ORF Transcript_34326/g.91771 Transcript_34326/m.91771 type:complete len:184 (+) Transcript_34326:435-986(+)